MKRVERGVRPLPEARRAAGATELVKRDVSAPASETLAGWRPGGGPRRLRGAVSLRADSALELRDGLTRTFDRGGDDQITDADFHGPGRAPPKKVVIHGPQGEVFTVAGVEQISQLATAAADHVRAGRGAEWFRAPELMRPRSQALASEVSRNWDRFQRRYDSVEALLPALAKLPVASPDGKWRIYVPESDPAALARLRAEAAHHPRVEVRAFPTHPDEKTWADLNAFPGMAYLPKPALAPGGMFTEMYGWDSVFMGLGVLAGERPDRYEVAKNILENFVYEIDHYGKVPNSNASHLMSRSQPPLMPRLALALDDLHKDPALLRQVATAGLKELDSIWRSGVRRTASGLSRYSDDHAGKLIEIPKDRYQHFPEDPDFLVHQRAIRESGHDDTHQFGDDAQHHESVELNSLLFRYERELAEVWRRVEGPKSPTSMRLEEDAASRARTMQDRFWDEKAGVFFDYHVQRGARTGYLSCATFFPLADGWATPAQARRVAENATRFLEKGGLAATARSSREAAGGESLQWDHPFGWGPLQHVAVEGLRRFGADRLANEIAYRWLYMVLDIAGRNNGLIKEKYDVVKASPEVEVEYGNQGTGRGGLTKPEAGPLGFGWTNATYVTLLQGLPPELRAQLDAGVSPETLFPRFSRAARRQAPP
jgi:alpha,alpha-trehalase